MFDNKFIELLIPTDGGWVQEVLRHFNEFLQDHANCERKASALAMSMVVKYPDRSQLIPELIAIAQEELGHFQRVYKLMEARGVPLAKDTPDPYVNNLLQSMRNGREDRFLDRLLIAALVECRGAERFGLLAHALTDPALQRFYHTLWVSELKHSHRFIDMALYYFQPETIHTRLSLLVQQEAEIIMGLPRRPALH